MQPPTKIARTKPKNEEVKIETQETLKTFRFATFNTALSRNEAGMLHKELLTGDSLQAKAIAAIVNEVKPDILLLQEIDLPNGGDDEKESLEILNLLVNQSVSQ